LQDLVIEIDRYYWWSINFMFDIQCKN